MVYYLYQNNEYSKPQKVDSCYPFVNLFPVEYYEKIPTVDLVPLATEIIKENTLAIIKPYNLSKLRKICKQKGITLFKQCYSSQTALLSYEEEKV